MKHAAEPVAGPVRVPAWAFPAVTAASLLVGVTAIVRGTRAVVTILDSDLTNFFFKSAEQILRGHPWQIYAVHGSGVTASYPNYNPPLSIFLMAPLLALAHAVGFASNYGEQITFVSLPFILLVPVLGWLVMKALRALYPGISDAQRFLAYVLVVLSPLTWQSIATWYHIEQPLMLCFLLGAVLALQRRHEGLAGVLAALAVLSRTTALMPLIGLGVLLLVAREWRGLLKLALVGGGLTLLAMAPFFVFDLADTKYALLTWRSGAPIGGNTIWAIFTYPTQGHLAQLAAAGAKRLDEFVVVLFVVAVAWVAARWMGVSAYHRDAWAVLGLAALAVPMLSKTNWPYYFLEPFILLLVWEFSSMHDRVAGVWRWPVLSIAYLAVTATLSQYIGLQSVGYLDRVSVGVLDSGAMAAFAWAMLARLRAKKPEVFPATAPATGAGERGGRPAMAAPAGERPVVAAPATPYPARGAGPLPNLAEAAREWRPAVPVARPAPIRQQPQPDAAPPIAPPITPPPAGAPQYPAPSPRAPLWPADSGTPARMPGAPGAPGDPDGPGTPNRGYARGDGDARRAGPPPWGPAR